MVCACTLLATLREPFNVVILEIDVYPPTDNVLEPVIFPKTVVLTPTFNDDTAAGPNVERIVPTKTEPPVETESVIYKPLVIDVVELRSMISFIVKRGSAEDVDIYD